MTGYLLPLTADPWQVCTPDVTIGGEAFQVQVEIRYLPAPDRWFISVWDHASGELLVNMVPLICSRGEKNDLLASFRHLRDGRGVGFLLCLRGTNEPSTPDPAGNNLTDFQALFADSL